MTSNMSGKDGRRGKSTTNIIKIRQRATTRKATNDSGGANERGGATPKGDIG
jgi:hypothetical protein